MFKKTGNIDSFADIPWDKQIIITGSIAGNKSYFQRMEGTFRKDNDNFRFVDDFGMSTHFNKNDSMSLNILEKQIDTGCPCPQPPRVGSVWHRTKMYAMPQNFNPPKEEK